MAFVGSGLVVGKARGGRGGACLRRTRVQMGADVGLSALNLTPALEKMVSQLKMYPDSKVRYQQLLHYAAQLGQMDDALKTNENKVKGCTSTVYCHATLDKSDNSISFVADSDAQLTKGLVAILVNGLSGCQAEEIIAVNPDFIKDSGLAVSLTPSRNNGFLNMLQLMKEKANNLASGTSEDGDEPEGEQTGEQEVAFEIPGKPVSTAVGIRLQQLKPVSLEVEDFSDQHAGHASKPANGESHIRIKIVAEAFEGMSLVLRHKMIYTLLDEYIGDGGIHALQIDAKSPSE